MNNLNLGGPFINTIVYGTFALGLFFLVLLLVSLPKFFRNKKAIKANPVDEGAQEKYLVAKSHVYGSFFLFSIGLYTSLAILFTSLNQTTHTNQPPSLLSYVMQVLFWYPLINFLRIAVIGIMLFVLIKIFRGGKNKRLYHILFRYINPLTAFILYILLMIVELFVFTTN